MAPIPVWSGNLRLSLVLVPVKMFPAVSTEGTIAFRMIHEPSGKPVRYVKGIETDEGFKEVPEEEIIKGYEQTKGHYVLIKPEELNKLKLEAKHTIDMARFVDRDEIDSRYFEKPYYLLPDGEDADEGYVVLRDALAKSQKVAIGQLIMHGREHLVGITAHKKGLMLMILRYEVRATKAGALLRQDRIYEGGSQRCEARRRFDRATVGQVRASEATKRICPGHP
jgi:DNA end-binding protein Ku